VDLKKLNRVPMVVAMALLMVLVIATAVWAAPSEKGENNGRGDDKKAASEEQPSSEPTPADNGGQGCDGSHGSDTGNGANTDDGGAGGNEYHNTCDGTASDNGNDSGGAGGRPCAGCVGNADDKNPPGQHRNGDDANNGYECDGNNGVGGKKSSPAAGNPAHTGCRRPPTDVCTVNCGPPPTCPPGDASCTPPNCPTGSNKPGCVPPTCPDGSQMLPNGKCNPPSELCPDGTPMPPSGRCNKPPKLCPDGTPMPPDGTCVRGIIIDRDKNPGLPDVVQNARIEAAPEPQPQVAPQGAVLPFTGGDLMPVLTLALILLAVGGLAVRRPASAVATGNVEMARVGEPGATIQLPSGKTFTVALRRVL
jgi:hypothetical protein